jgi:hypothetical protein
MLFVDFTYLSSIAHGISSHKVPAYNYLFLLKICEILFGLSSQEEGCFRNLLYSFFQGTIAS